MRKIRVSTPKLGKIKKKSVGYHPIKKTKMPTGLLEGSYDHGRPHVTSKSKRGTRTPQGAEFP